MSEWEDVTPQRRSSDGWEDVSPTSRTPSVPKVSESPTSARNLIGAALEPIMSLASGSIAGPVAGLVGGGAAIGKGLGMTQKEPGDVVRSISSALTYAPRTQGGQTALGAIGYPFEKLGEVADWTGEKIADAGYPAVGAGVNALMQTVPQIALGGGLKRVAPVKGIATASPEVQMLANKGVTMTPGEILGGKWSGAEQRLESLPIAGPFIRSARGKGIEQFSNATINDALSPIGEKLPSGLKGNQAIEYAYGVLGDKYETLLPKTIGDLDYVPQNRLAAPEAQPSSSFRSDLDNIRQLGQNLPPQEFKYLNDLIDKEVIGKFTSGGRASGETLKGIQETLRTEANDFRRGGPYERKLAGAIDEISASMRRMVQEVNPTLAPELQAVDRGYAIFKIAQKAATSLGSNEGVFTPNQYRAAVRSSDKSKDKGRFAEGNALQQDMAEAGRSVLSDTVRNSGTPERALMAELVLGAGGHSLLGPQGIALGLSVPALYSQPVLRALQGTMIAPPNVGHALSRTFPVGAMGILRSDNER